MPEKGPSQRAMRAFPVFCGTCAAEPGHGCRNAWGRKVNYQHEGRKRAAKKGS